jgi:hypothetical protein
LIEIRRFIDQLKKSHNAMTIAASSYLSDDANIRQIDLRHSAAQGSF